MPFPVNVDATWVNPGSVQMDAGELRRADSAMFGGTGAPLGVRGGIVRHGSSSLAVTVDGSDVVTVQPGAVVIPGNAVSGTGCYRSALASATTGALAARNATNPRIDLVVFRQLDTDVVGTHGAYTARIEIIAGTPSATPSVPTLPSMAVELARITVPAAGGGAASVDSTFCTYATALGADLIASTVSTLPGDAPIGQRARVLDAGVTYEWNGSIWLPRDGYINFVPTLTNFTRGNGTLVGRFMQHGKNVKGEVRFIAGTTSTFPGGILTFSLPVAPASDYDTSVDSLGHGNVNNNTSASRTTVEVMRAAAGSGNVILAFTGGLVTAVAPFAFGSVSRIGFAFDYRID